MDLVFPWFQAVERVSEMGAYNGYRMRIGHFLKINFTGNKPIGASCFK